MYYFLIIIIVFYCFLCFVVQRGWCHVLISFFQQLILLFVKCSWQRAPYIIKAMFCDIIFKSKNTAAGASLFSFRNLFLFFFGFLIKRPHPWPLVCQGGGLAAGTRGTATCPTLYCQPHRQSSKYDQDTLCFLCSCTEKIWGYQTTY